MLVKLVITSLAISLACSPPSLAQGPTQHRAQEARPGVTPPAPPLATIAVQLRAVERAVQRSRRQGTPNAELQAALDALVQKIPRSARTRALQEQARGLYQRMAATNSPAEAKLLQENLREVTGLIGQDPDYARTLKALEPTFLSQPEAGFSASGSTVALQSRARSFPLSQLKPGDILLWQDGPGKHPSSKIGPFDYARTFTHAAIYMGDQGLGGPKGQRRTYEASSPSEGVRTFLLDDRWTRSGMRVAIGRVKNRSDLQNYTTAIRAYNRFGDHGKTHYHTYPPWGKDYLSDGLYCSQLVWVAFRQSGVDLDSNRGSYIAWFAARHPYVPQAGLIAWFAVFPDEIRASDKIHWFYDQVNP